MIQHWFLFICLAALLPEIVVGGDDYGNLPPPPAAQDRVTICSNHPNIDQILKRNGPKYTIPTTHPTIHPLFMDWFDPDGMPTYLYVCMYYY
jgi:hypothetical protein